RSFKPNVLHEEDCLPFPLPFTSVFGVPVGGIVTALVHAPAADGEGAGHLRSVAAGGAQQHLLFQRSPSPLGTPLSSSCCHAHPPGHSGGHLHCGVGGMGGP